MGTAGQASAAFLARFVVLLAERGCWRNRGGEGRAGWQEAVRVAWRDGKGRQ
ncbi:MAG: hypothetical protein LBG06_02255 [Deltaproteobacteria bacterium]|nr:hypothetical protein [Deltaproteobacteria bacterium]